MVCVCEPLSRNTFLKHFAGNIAEECSRSGFAQILFETKSKTIPFNTYALFTKKLHGTGITQGMYIPNIYTVCTCSFM